MLLFYIRHGDPIYDPDSLTPLGQEQAKALAKRLIVHGVDKVYSSPSNRARMTAQPLSVLLDFLKEGTADTIFGYAAEHPDVVKPYDSMYPILLWKNKSDQEN